MTATALAVVPRNNAVRYDGTNSADIDALIPDFTIISESGSSMTIESGGGQNNCPVGGWIIYNEAGVVYDIVANDAAFAGRFHNVAVVGEMSSLSSEVADLAEVVDGLPELPPNIVGSAGATTFAAIIGLGTVNVTVQLAAAMADSSYTALAIIFGGVGILSNVEVLSITVNDADTVTVQIRNNSITALGGTVLVIAVP